jgi:hypothetical protein
MLVRSSVPSLSDLMTSGRFADWRRLQQRYDGQRLQDD